MNGVIIYDLPNKAASLRRVGMTLRATGAYTREKYEVGKFSLTMPATAPFANEMKKDRLLQINGEYWGVITGISATEGDKSQLTVSGSELKEWLHRRVFVPLENDKDTSLPIGYDYASGSTESIMKTAVDRHAVNPIRPSRAIVGLLVADNRDRGIKNDSYLFRYSALDEGLTTIGKRANIGWYIYGAINTGRLVFDVIPQIDFTVNQAQRRPLVFQVLRHNAKTIAYTVDSSASANVFYCTRNDNVDIWEKLTLQYNLDSEIEPEGYQRREIALDISVDADSDNTYDELELLSRQRMEEYRQTETVQCEIEGLTDNIELGYLCTVILPFNARADMEVTSITTNISATSQTKSVTFGTPKITQLNILKRNLLKGGN